MSDVKPATTEERAEWKRLAEDATSGPWIVMHGDGIATDSGSRFIVDYDPSAACIDSYDNAMFIAAARTAVPALEAALVEAEKRVDAYEQLHKASKRDMEVHQRRGDCYRDERDQLRAQVAALSERCTALEQELKENEGVIAVWRGRTQRAEQVLEALEAIGKHNHHHEDYMAGANEYTRAIRIAVVGALHPEYRTDHHCQFKYADGSYCFSAAGNPCPAHRGGA